ncbi:MAG: glycosyltransferase [Pseudomonadota bacterium]|nr:glycosyltransferase [Pseudomonadota bacterium]
MTDSRKPIVVHLVTSLDFGGVESHMETLARHAAGSSMALVFHAIGPGGAVERSMKTLGAHVVAMNLSTRLPALSSIVTLYRLFRRMRPLVVHTHGAEANVCGLIAAWLARVPVRIGEEIGMPDHGPKARAVFRGIYMLAHRVVGISQAVTDWLVASGEVPPRKAVRLYNPVELPAFAQDAPSLESVFRIGFVGRLEQVKNPRVLIDVLAGLRRDGIAAELWLVGDGSQRAMLQAHADEQGMSQHVVFHGYQPDPARFVRQCHVYVQPSLSEGFGLAFVEAMGAGVPVIVSAFGGAAEIVQHDVTGWIVAEPSEALLTGALLSVHGLGTQHLLSVGRAARTSVERRFQPASYLTALDALYAQVLHGASPSIART